MTTRPYPDPSSRFQILPSPLLSPAQCSVCGSPSRPVVDAKIDLTVNGLAYRVYFCVLCFQDASVQVNGYLESQGQDTGGSATPAQINRYLNDNNLKVISSDHLDNLAFWATGSSAVVDAILDDPLNAESAEGESGNDAEDDADVQRDDNVDDGDSSEDDERVPAFAL